VYWTTGNPSPDYNGDERLGDNLYASSVVALDARSGRLKWHFQFTPHNVWDWDAQQPTVLVDATWEGRPRRLLVQASRNGFFYVLDRVDGTFLLVNRSRQPDVGARDQPRRTGAAFAGPGQIGGVRASVHPARRGWSSTSYSRRLGTSHVQTVENCNVFS
jgi:alcohol dehydrogenase (cytochrome c)